MPRLRESRRCFARMDLLWKMYFIDPLLWHESRNVQVRRASLLSAGMEMEEMHNKEIASDRWNEDAFFVASLKASAMKKDLSLGSKIHASILQRGSLEKNPYLANSLINMYSKCGMLLKAREVLDAIPVRDAVSWSALIAGYVQQGQGEEALNCFARMLNEGIPPDVITYTSVLKACANTGAVSIGRRIHEDIMNAGLLEKDIMLSTALVDMYAKCGMLAKAQSILEKLPFRNVVSWSALIAGYVDQGHGHEALHCFEMMQRESISPNAVTFVCILKACSMTGAICKGKQIHYKIRNTGLLQKSIALGNALLDMYVKCGLLTNAQRVFEDLPIRDVVSWSTMIAGYCEHGQVNEALTCSQRLQCEGLSPSEITFVSLLKACSNIKAIDKGKQIHVEIFCKGQLENNTLLGNALVDMYVKCSEIAKAQQVHEELPERDVASWNVLLSGYVHEVQGQKALKCIEQMQRQNLAPTMITLTYILKLYGIIGSVEKGKEIHDYILRNGLLEKDIVLGNATIDMYAKCGTLAKAQGVLEVLPLRDVVSWNTMITGYSVQRKGYQAVNCFRQMQNEGLQPNGVTFLCILSACSHTGLLGEAQGIFENMTKYHVTPDFEHHMCMLIAFVCAGDFDNAIAVIKMMPFSDCPLPWLSVLEACRKWRNVKLGSLVYEQTLTLDRSCATGYILMANIFANAGIPNHSKYGTTKSEKETST